MDTFIYALIDPRDNQVRYIGKTVWGKRRPRQHLHNSRMQWNKAKCAWVDELKAAGLEYEILTLAECSVEDVNDAEIFCIAYYRHIGANLLNRTDGGAGCLGLRHTAETRAKITRIVTGRRQPPKSAKTLARMSAVRKKQVISPEHLNSFLSGVKAARLRRSYPVVTNDGRWFESVSAAARGLGLARRTVERMLVGETHRDWVTVDYASPTQRPKEDNND